MNSDERGREKKKPGMGRGGGLNGCETRNPIRLLAKGVPSLGPSADSKWTWEGRIGPDKVGWTDPKKGR